MSKPIRCSELGQIARCPHAVKLKYAGATVSNDARLRMTRGDDAHKRFNDQLQTSRTGLLFKVLFVVFMLVIGAWLAL